MAARSKARKRALDVLFEAEVRGLPVLDLLAERITIGDPPVSEYAADLVRGVSANVDRIDSLLAEYAEGWTLDRMPAVDRNVLRIGVYELLWSSEVPAGVAISEAVALVHDLSTEASPAFVNGILARLAALDPPLPPAAASAAAASAAAASSAAASSAVGASAADSATPAGADDANPVTPAGPVTSVSEVPDPAGPR